MVSADVPYFGDTGEEGEGTSGIAEARAEEDGQFSSGAGFHSRTCAGSVVTTARVASLRGVLVRVQVHQRTALSIDWREPGGDSPRIRHAGQRRHRRPALARAQTGLDPIQR